VSDQDYLREFYSGYSGYRDSDRYFLDEWGRGLEDRTESVRRNQLNLNTTWQQFSLNADIRWYDDVIIRKNNDPDPTLQMLPHVEFDSSRTELPQTPFYLDLDSSYDYFWRDIGTKGHRMDLHPRFYYPVELLKYLAFEPSVGVRETAWQVEKYEDEDPERDDHFEYRTVFDFKADLSTEFSRVYDMGSRTVRKIRHAVRPQVVYDYIPVPDQDDYPYFEGIDRIEEQHILTYSITNYFTAKTITPQEAGTNEREHSQKSCYDDFCRIKLWQSYDIREARGHVESGKKRPFSDIEGEVELRLSDYVDLDADVAWSPYDGNFTSYNALLALGNDRGDNAFIDYRYTRGETESIRARLNVKLFDPVSAYCEAERDLKDTQGVETVVGFRYEPQCWSIDIGYTRDSAIDSYGYLFEIKLHGLGKKRG
jgi:LPS-assembly protein